MHRIDEASRSPPHCLFQLTGNENNATTTAEASTRSRLQHALITSLVPSLQQRARWYGSVASWGNLMTCSLPPDEGVRRMRDG